MATVFRCDSCLKTGDKILDVGLVLIQEKGGNEVRLEVCRNCFNLHKARINDAIQSTRIREAHQ